jgi:hypothetical protein
LRFGNAATSAGLIDQLDRHLRVLDAAEVEQQHPGFPDAR